MNRAISNLHKFIHELTEDLRKLIKEDNNKDLIDSITKSLLEDIQLSKQMAEQKLAETLIETNNKIQQEYDEYNKKLDAQELASSTRLEAKVTETRKILGDLETAFRDNMSADATTNLLACVYEFVGSIPRDTKDPLLTRLSQAVYRHRQDIKGVGFDPGEILN